MEGAVRRAHSTFRALDFLRSGVPLPERWELAIRSRRIGQLVAKPTDQRREDQEEGDVWGDR